MELADDQQGEDQECIVFFHGTVGSRAARILRHVSVSGGRPDLDFGPGFYTTRSRDQAERWARDLSSTYHENHEDPAVVEITVDAAAYRALDRWELPAVWSVQWEDLVRSGRSGENERNPLVHDVIDGPFLGSTKRIQQLISGALTGADAVRPRGDQQAWKTDAAEKVLNESRRRRVL